MPDFLRALLLAKFGSGAQRPPPQRRGLYAACDRPLREIAGHADGAFDLTVLARPGGRVLLTLTVLGDGREPFAADGARMDTDQQGEDREPS